MPRDFPGVVEIHVDDGTDDLDDITCVHKKTDRRGDMPGARESQGNELVQAGQVPSKIRPDS